MAEVNQLYGKKLTSGGEVSLTDQVYDIFRREIFSGRWSAGERMPSFKALSEMTGLSRYPLKTALDRLEEEGYIEKIRHKGIFLRKTKPNGAVLGRVVVYADSGSFSRHHNGIPKFSEGFGLIDVLNLQKHAKSRGYALDISDQQRLSNIIDNDEVKGIISLLPIDTEIQDQINVPVVFLGVEDPLCRPNITGSNYTAMYEITKTLINLGHKEIAVFAPDFWAAEQVDKAFAGHTRALWEAGIPFNRKSVELSENLKHDSIKSAKKFINAFPEATAVLAMSLDSAVKIGEYAELAGLKIPEDFGLASLQLGYYSDYHGHIFGAEYNWKAIIKTAFNLILDEKFEINRNAFSRITMHPELNHKSAHSISP